MRWLMLLLLAACESGSATPPKKQPPRVATTIVDAAVVDRSAEHYAKLCAPCHAADGSGYTADHSPSLINPTFLESASDEFLRRSIIAGRPGTSMGAYGKQLGGPLDDGEILRLVAFLRAKGPQPGALTAGAPGDATRGAKLYDAQCKRCHGDARVRGEAPHLANSMFLMLASDPFIRYAIENGRPKTKMEPFAKTLSSSQIDDVVAYVRAFASGPVESLLPEPTGKEPIVLNPQGKDPVWKPREDRFIGVDDVKRALAEKRRIAIIDARPPSEWRRVHIAGAVSIPYHDLARLDAVPKDVYAIAYCACPHHLSGIVADELVKRGHTKALVLDEGINVWHQRGYPVVAAEGVTPPPKEPPKPPAPAAPAPTLQR